MNNKQVPEEMFVIIDNETGIKSKPVSIEWFLFGEEDLEFENDESLPLKDFKFFRSDYTILPASIQKEVSTPDEKDKPESHKEFIVCPHCNSVQEATVEHTEPFATFVHNCENCEYVIMESEWRKATDEEIAFHNYVEAKNKLGTLGWNTFINSKEVEEYRAWLRNDKYKHRIDWFEKEYPGGLYYFDKELNNYVGIRLMTKKFLAEADAAYELPHQKDKPATGSGGGAEAIVKELTDIRNKLYNELPTGEVKVWDLIQIIKWHCNDLDTFINKLATLRQPVGTESFLQQLRRLSVERAKEGFKTYENQPITYWTTAIIGEFGELCNMIKKMKRAENGGHDSGHSYTAKSITPKMIREELGGTLIYIDLLASVLGIDLEEAIIETFNEKSAELNFPYFLKPSSPNPPEQITI